MDTLIRALQKCLGSLRSDAAPGDTAAAARSLEAIQTLKNSLAEAESVIRAPSPAAPGDPSTVVPPDPYPKVRVPRLSTQPGGPPDSVRELERRFTPFPLGDLQTVVPDDRSPARSDRGAGVAGLVERTGASGDLPARFGKYVLLERIGRGGMGVVYKAEQSELNRLVALKTIRFADSASPEELRRFQLEAEAAARLNHPHIVQVYEFGEHAGEQFFTMAFVDGQSLAAKLAAGPVAPRDAAALMRTVADAVAYAHEHGVVHRDLKPANILLDSAESPHITDFGLAKKIDDDSSLTATGQVMGTPSYMAPEQAIGNTEDVGPLSDVYSLGAVLYALLVGRPPFQAANVLETLKLVVDQEPVPPRQLIRTIDRDLETICLKCLAKEPYRRYPSARALADDLGRYMAGEPVLARPVGAAARAWRWCRRKPLLAGALAAAVFFLVAGSCFSIYFAVAESRRAQEADSNFLLAQEVVENLYTRVSEEILFNKPGMQELRRDLLAEALRYYQRFVARSGGDDAIRDSLARAHFRVGLISEEIESPGNALPAYRRAENLQRKLAAEQPGDLKDAEALADTLVALGRTYHRIDEPAQAYAAFEEAVRIRQHLVAAHPHNREYRRILANSIMNLGKLDETENRADQAERRFQHAQRMRLDLAQDGDDSPQLVRDTGIGHFNLGALAYADAAESGNPESFQHACEQFRAAADCFKSLTERNPDDIDSRHRLANCYRLLGESDYGLQNWDRAIGWYRQADELVSRLAQENPSVRDLHWDRARILISLCDLLYLREEKAQSFEAIRHAADILGALVQNEPDDTRYRRDYAIVLRAQAMLQAEHDDRANAEQSFRSSAAILKELVAQFPDDALYQAELEKTEHELKAFLGP